MRLTPAAHTLLAHGAALDAQWERARADLAALQESELTGSLRLCGFSTAAAVVADLPEAARKLRWAMAGQGVTPLQHVREAAKELEKAAAEASGAADEHQAAGRNHAWTAVPWQPE